MISKPVKVGIVGLGRWAKVLTRAALQSDKFEIVCGFSRSVEKREAYQQEFGISCAATMEALLGDPDRDPGRHLDARARGSRRTEDEDLLLDAGHSSRSGRNCPGS